MTNEPIAQADGLESFGDELSDEAIDRCLDFTRWTGACPSKSGAPDLAEDV